ncbi:MAG TPA: DUF6167 family protein [Nocardioidaceae bacterium]|nr:DUF6167 family protein [Nocardioidaceae bacterium]
MARAIWFVAGAGLGVYATVRARRAAEAFTPDGMRDRLAGLSLGAHLFGQEVRAGMAEKETDLRSRLETAQLSRSPERVAIAPTGEHEQGEDGN